MADLLVVDDDDDVREVIAEILRSLGHEVREARDGREGFALANGRRPDLVLLDVEMPVLTGPEMASLMRLQDEGLEKIPIVFASGIVGLPNIAARIGTPYFIRKPYELQEMLDLVRRALTERVCPGAGGSP